MSQIPPRKVPRIISRVKPKIETKTGVDERCSTLRGDHTDLVRNDLLDELGSEKVVIRDGIVVAVQQSEKKNNIQVMSGHSNRRVVIDAGLPAQEQGLYTEKPLPDEVESYPCKYCPNHVFLTTLGLEKHAREFHVEHLQEIMAYMTTIQEEWIRRERERGRQRERAQMAKLRQESIAHAAVRNSALRITEIEVGQEVSISDQMEDEHFEACRICSLLINANHPTAMENHLRAHKKNDELRSQLLAEYGSEIVGRLTCHDCHLVFTEDSKLALHIEHTHVRRRRFVCKWCGHLCASMTDLNNHKADVHAMPACQSRQERNMIMRNNAIKARARVRAEQFVERCYGPGNQDAVCRTNCEECGLRLLRPSLLIRHMLRVHSKESFSCKIETNGIEPFRIEVDQARIRWVCCNAKYVDKQEFNYHRRTEHLEKMNQTSQQEKQIMESSSSVMNELNTNELPIQPGTAAYTGQIVHNDDGSMQVVLPEGIDTSGDIYVVMLEDNMEIAKNQQNAYEVSGSNSQEPIQIQGEHQMGVDDDTDTVAITEEQYQELREQYGDDLNDLQIVFMNDDMEHGGHMVVHHDHNVDMNVGRNVSQQQPHPQNLNIQQHNLVSHQPELTNEEIFEP
ncbi:unnamed protein product [Auanema sp. JU1783]|nr:unnamed protein product [Auanema sp. JU1783]